MIKLKIRNMRIVGRDLMSSTARKKVILGLWSLMWCVVFLLTCLRTGAVMFHHVALDYNEGWNALLAGWGIGVGGHQLYSSETGFIFNNYPPLSFFIFGWVIKLGGDAIIVGRIISCLSIILSSILIQRLINIMTRSALSGWAGSLIFLATMNTAFYNYFGMNDPQWLAQCLMLVGVYILFSSGRVSFVWWRLLLSVLFIVLGGFTKHNLVALPLALCVWMFFLDKEKAFLWASMLVICLGIGFSICYQAYGMFFFHDVFLHKRTVRLGHIVHGMKALLLMVGIVVSGIGVAIYYRKKIRIHDNIVFALLFLMFALFFGLMGSMGAGVDYNSMFDVLVAGTLLCGIGLATLLNDARCGSVMSYMCATMSLSLVFLVPIRGMSFYHDIVSIHDKEASWAENIRLMQAHKDDTLCTDMALCYWAHATYPVDMFNLAEALKVGGGPYPVQAFIMNHKVAFVQLYGAPDAYRTKSTYFDGWLQKAGYRPVFTGQGHMLLLSYKPL
ncbi:MAG: hypothetical protein M3Z59_03845 [Bombella apis]|nr:hypothetical protein [Bombella apis]